MVRRLSAGSPSPAPGSPEPPAGERAHAAHPPAPGSLPQGRQELGGGGADASGGTHQLAGLKPADAESKCCVLLHTDRRLGFTLPVQMHFKNVSWCVFQAFRRTMALCGGDVDEAVLFAKVEVDFTLKLSVCTASNCQLLSSLITLHCAQVFHSASCILM